MSNSFAFSAITVGVLLVSGCSASIPQPSATAIQGASGASTIEEAWEKVGCGDSNGRIDDPGLTDGVERTATCTPYDGGELVFFYQQDSAAALSTWLDSGALEVGATDALFRDGAVAILATDAGTAQKFDAVFDSAE